MKKLTEDQQDLLAYVVASDIHTSLLEAAKQRYTNEILTLGTVQSGIEKAFQKVLRNVFSD